MYRVDQTGIREVIVPMVNPLNSRNVDEVLRRDKVLREETLRRESDYADEPSRRPKRMRSIAQKLAKLMGGGRE